MNRDRDELEHFFLSAFPNPERVGCPDDTVLKAIAEGRLPADHPAQLHIGSCSECYAECRHYRLDWAESHGTPAPLVAVTPRKTPRLTKALLAIAAVVLVMILARQGFMHYRATGGTEQIASTAETVDLFEHGTTRGVDNGTPVPPVMTVHPARIRLSIILPRFSEAGGYEVAVCGDQRCKHILTSAVGTTHGREKLVLDVNLDLHSATPGSYFLATVRQSDRGAYYYPMQVNSQ